MADREKRGKDRNRKFWLSQEWNELFDEIKSIFLSFWRAIIWWKNTNLIKIADTSFKSPRTVLKKNSINYPTKCLFSSLSHLSTSSNNIFKVKRHRQTLIILKKQLNHLKVIDLKKKQIYPMAIFYTAQNFLCKLKMFILTVLQLKWNKTCCIEFFFVKIFVVNSRQVMIFFSVI